LTLEPFSGIKILCAKEGEGSTEQLLELYHMMFYPGFKFTVFEIKISFIVVYLHTIWTFTLMRRISVVR
jgi:hypothetical protein